MGQVTVTVNNRAFTLACDDGEEDHLRELASYLDRHVAGLTEKVGQVGDARLLLMAGLVVADELSDTLADLDRARQELENVGNARSKDVESMQAETDRLAEFFDTASQRLESLARRISAG